MSDLAILFVVVGAPAVAVGFLYWRFRTSPAGDWKHRLVRHIHSLQGRLTALRHDPPDLQQAMARLADEALHRHLRTIPIERLADYPNIGPATIARLQENGLRNIADARDIKFETLGGIGAGRGTSLVKAMAALVKEARSRFNAGACPEAQEYRRQADELRVVERQRAEGRHRELLAVEIAVKESLDLFPIAREVTFFNFLLRKPAPGLTDDLLRRPLPEPRILPAPPPVPVVVPTPEPPAVPVSPAVAAKRSPDPPVLPPAPPAPLPPPAIADLFRAELGKPAAQRGGVATAAEHPDLPRMRAVVGFGLMMAKVDGRLAQAEKKAIRAFLEANFGHDAVLVRNIDPLMERVAKAIPDEETALAAIRATTTPAELRRLHAWAEQIAAASGAPNQKERDTLARVAAAFGLQPAIPEPNPPSPAGPNPPSPFPRREGGEDVAPPSRLGKGDGGLGSDPPPSRLGKGDGGLGPTGDGGLGPPYDPRAVLDIAPDAPLDADLIRRRYVLLTEKLDPARAAAFGPEFAHLAEQKRARIRAAAEALIAPFGEPLEKPAEPPLADLRHNPDLDDVFGM